jgi:protein-tyrosine phosphatase
MEIPVIIPLEGASNVRDLGGYVGRDGRRVRTGVVFRSAALAKLTAGDLATLGRLGLQTVWDFRGVQERLDAPTVLSGPDMVSVPIEPTVGAGLRDILHTKQATGDALHAVLERAYVAYALESQSQYRTVFERVLAGGTPLLFHCSAGKDRTGFGAALVLTAVGVAWPDVVADFEATNRLWRRDTVPAADIPPAIRESLLRAEPLLLEAAFAAARAQHGSMDAYYERALGLGPAERRRLDQILLEPG